MLTPQSKLEAMGKYLSGTGIARLLVFMMILFCRIPAVPAAVHTVGDSSGWAIGPDYSTWAGGKTFAVGDTLVFNYPSGHTVDEVSANDYKACSTGNSISSDSSGATSITLKTAGPHYYICGIPGHCSSGMKLAVTVAAAPSGGGGGGGGGKAASPSETTTGPANSSPPGHSTPAAGTVNQPSSSAMLSPVRVSAIFSILMVASKWFVL